MGHIGATLMILHVKQVKLFRLGVRVETKSADSKREEKNEKLSRISPQVLVNPKLEGPNSVTLNEKKQKEYVTEGYSGY